MHFEHPEELPELKKLRTPAEERLNERIAVQFQLMARYPQGDMKWSLRYAETFGDLFDHDHDFHELVVHAQKAQDPDLLRKVQDALDAKIDKH